MVNLAAEAARSHQSEENFLQFSFVEIANNAYTNTVNQDLEEVWKISRHLGLWTDIENVKGA